jgi:hypothetical protein
MWRTNGARAVESIRMCDYYLVVVVAVDQAAGVGLGAVAHGRVGGQGVEDFEGRGVHGEVVVAEGARLSHPARLEVDERPVAIVLSREVAARHCADARRALRGGVAPLRVRRRAVGLRATARERHRVLRGPGRRGRRRKRRVGGLQSAPVQVAAAQRGGRAEAAVPDGPRLSARPALLVCLHTTRSNK